MSEIWYYTAGKLIAFQVFFIYETYLQSQKQSSTFVPKRTYFLSNVEVEDNSL